jgi:CRP-like cAMP-binding protein
MFIQRADLFRGMDQVVIKKINEIMIEESCAEGTVLFERGKTANDLYIVKEGSVELIVGENGHVTYVVKKPGEAFGWSSLVNHHVYTASAVCSSPTEFIRIPSDKLNKVFEKNPASGLMFFRRLAEIISKRVATSYNLLLRSHERTSRYLRSVGGI